MSQSPPQSNEEIKRLCREAEESWKRLDYQRCINLLEQAAGIEPSNASLHFNLARAYGSRYDYSAVKRCIEKALQATQDHVRMLEEAAKICSPYKNLDLMLGYLERASKKNGVSPGALVSLADIYILDDRIDEAAETIDRVARLTDRKNPQLLLREAILKQKRGQISRAESIFRDLLRHSAAEAVVRIRAACALAGILDNRGEYDEAVAILLEAKAIQHPQAMPLAVPLQQMQNLDKELPRILTAAVLDRWQADAVKLQPARRLALLSGHPRSGTTILEQVLDAHSDIMSLEETDLLHDEIFRPLVKDFPPGSDLFQILDSAPPDTLNRFRENYFHCAEMFLGKTIGNRVLIDKNPGKNLMVSLLLRVFPETKFLLALRDPRDVVISCFMQALTLTPASSAYVSIEGTVKQYASVMGFWLEMLPSLGNRVMQIRYEDMIEDLPGAARSALKFLGVGFEDNVLKFFEHARAKRVNSPSSADARKPLYRTAVGRWKHYEKYLEPYMPALERFLKEFKYT